MKKFRFRGKDHVVGDLKIDPAAAQKHYAKGLFHTLVPSLPAPPASTSYASAAAAGLATMLGNDKIGDCAIACDWHLDALRAANAGGAYTPEEAQAIAEYTAITGYDPNDPSTDQGTDPGALVSWRETNAYPSGVCLVGAPAVDATNQTYLKQALWLAVGLGAFAGLPDDWESEENAGDVWDVAGPSNPQNGHMFGLVDFGPSGITVVTWGELITLTYAAAAKYLIPSAGGGALAFLAEDCIAQMSQKAPSGFDFSTLATYLGLPPPAPSTLPAPK
jgi:hypothetical protein